MSEFPLDDPDGDSFPQSDRLQILSREEYELLWGFPRFTQSDRDLFFTLTAPEREALEQRRSVRTKIHFLLLLGYFRARQRFFRFELPAVRDDVDYLRRRYFDNVAVADLAVSLHTRQRHVDTILGLFRYRLCALEERAMLEAHARQATRVSSRPVYVLRELVDLLRRERVVPPGYTFLQDLVRGALAFERKRLAGALEGLIDAEDAKSLERLLADDEGLHQITTIKRQPRDFSYRQLLTEIERGQQLRPLFALSEHIIASLELSAESVRYYASLVEYYTVYKLKRMDREAVQLYLLCFIHDRHQRLNDNLLGAFCSLVRRYADEVDAATKEAIYRFKLQTSEDVEQGAKVLALFLDPGIDGQTPFATVRDRAHSLLAPERLQQLCRHLAGDGSLDEGAFEWREVDGIMAKVKRNLRPLLRFLSLQGTPANAVLLETLAAMVEAFGLGEPLPTLAVSTALIPARSKRYVLEPAGTIIRDRYEFMVYRQLRDGLEAGDLHCPDSARFRSFEDDLVDDATFNRRAELLPRHGLEVAAQPIREQLEELRGLIEERFASVNRRILAGENAFVRVQDGRTVWERAVRSEGPLPNEPFFDMVERVDIDTLLLFVDRRNAFMEAFEHVYGFRHPGHYNKDWPIKPIRRAREGLIVSEWPNIERILLSLALKSTTQSVIVGKLSAYRRKNRTKRALWEFDNIIRSLYLLDYIDSPVLRRNVQRALNRGEAYHQLRRSIAYAHGGRFRARSQHEQEIWNECSRLVGNAVVYYNALILSEALAELESRGELASAEVLKRVSPVAWQHINFYGRYQFDADFTPIDFVRLRQQLSSEEVSRLYATADR